jgi:hypothetical protein
VWPEEALNSVAKHFLMSKSLCDSVELEDAAVGICCYLHTSTEEFSDHYRRETKRENYITPSNLIHLLEMV